MKPKIVFLDRYTLNGAPLKGIEQIGQFTSYDNTSADELMERAGDAEIIITNKVPFDRARLAALPKLRLICVAATGLNTIDLDAAAQLGIEVRNAVGYSTESVTEATIGAAIALLRETVYYDGFIKQGRYSSEGRMFNFDRPTRRLHGRRWGIVGLGTIGHSVARVAAVLGCEVVYASTSGVERQEPYRRLTLEQLLATSDIVSVHCPLNPHTRGLIGRQQIETMKRDALLINMARGGIVDEAALASALDDNLIAGAALDVFTSEPIEADSPLLRIKNPYKLLLSPHNAWSAAESIEVLAECIMNNIRDYCSRHNR